MNTDDKKRVKAAASLRESANVGGARTLKRALAKALGIHLDAYTPEGSHTEILRGLADLLDRGTCRNVYNDEYPCSCANGFECDVCGNKVEDYEHYAITGKFEYCSGCGRMVVE